MVIQAKNLRTDYTSGYPITTFKVTFGKYFKQYHFDVEIKWNQMPEYCEIPDEVAGKQVMNHLLYNKNYKKINSGILCDFHYIAHFKKTNDYGI